MSDILRRKGAVSPHEELLFFNNEDVAGVRVGRWKYVTRSYYREGELPLDAYDYGLLFDLSADPGETYNVASAHAEVLADMRARVARARAEFGPLAKGRRKP